MVAEFLVRLKAFLRTPTPEVKPKEMVLAAFELVLVFGVFYFAIFKFNAPREEVYQGVIEGFSLGFSLFCSFLIWTGIREVYAKVTKTKRFHTFGFSLVFFLFVYTLGIAILYPIKQTIWEIEKSWVWRYYWRHLPYAFVIFSVYLYRQYKNVVIDNLVQQLNSRLDEAENKTNTIPRKNAPDEPLLKIQVDGINRTLLSSNISHISVNGHYLDIFSQKENETESICVRKSMTEIIEELPGNSFLRIHRSHIINLEHIAKLKKVSRQYRVELRNQQISLPISRSYLSDVLSRIEAKL